jgi:PAS domain S-box-containing protein
MTDITQATLDKWQGIVDLIAKMARVPAALIMRVEPPEIAVFRTSKNQGNPYQAGERAQLETGLYCETVMRERRMLMVPDALADPLWKDNPDVKLRMISYLGFPLSWPDGIIFGTICILDNKANAYDQLTIDLLALFQGIIEDDLQQIQATTAKYGALEEAQKQYQATIHTGERSRQALLSVLEDEKQTKGILKDSEQLSRAILEQSPIGISVRDRFGRLERCNATWQNLWAMTDQEVKKDLETERTSLALDQKDGYLGKWAAEVERVYKEGGNLHIPELKVSKPQIYGDRFISQYFYALAGPAGGVERVVILTQDITKRKLSEAIIIEGEQKFRQLAENIDTVFWITDWAEKKLLFVNQAYEKVFGLTTESAYSDRMEWMKAVHPDDLERVSGQLQSKASLGEFTELDYRIFCRGKLKWVHERAFPIKDNSGKVVRYLNAAEDITDRKQAEETLSKSEERLRTLIETQRDLITRWLPDTTLTYVNQAYSVFTGRKPEELLGRSWLLLTPEANRWENQRFYQELVQHPKIHDYEHQAAAADGKLHWISWSEVPIYDQSGRLLEFQSVGRDITERKQAELLQQALYQISETAIGCRDLQQLYIQLHRTIAKLIPSENLYLALYDERSDAISFPYYRDKYKDHYETRRFGKGLTEYIMTTKKPLLMNSQVYQQLLREGKAEVVGQPSTQWLGVPLMSENKAFGVLVVQSYDGKTEYTKKDLELLNFVAGNVAVAIRSIQTDQAIRESQEKYRDLVENINDVVFAVGADGVINYISPAVKQMAGYAPEDLVGKDFLGFIHPGDRAMMAGELQKKLSGKLHASEYRVLARDGSVRWVSSSSRIIMEAGKPAGLNGLMIDITEHKKADDLIKLAAKKWETTFDSIGDGICLLDQQGKVLQCNRAFSQLVKKSFEDILGRDCHELAHGQDHPLELCPITRMEESHHRESLEVATEGKTLFMAVDPIFDENKNLAGAVHTIFDISERKLMEQELLQSQKMEAVGFLAGGVAHDFNNMLAGIMGNAELLQLKVYGQQEQEAYVGNILKAAGHAAGLTKQLLAFARKGQYQQVPVNVHKIIAETLGILSSTIDRRIKIEQHLKANPAVILGDYSQLENALMNLGINARDAMPDGGKLIFSTELINLDKEYILQHNYKIEPGLFIQISVDDTGSGMTDEVKKHMFEPFFTTKEKGKGTGLGLAGVYGCVKNHGGSIEVYSEPGRGTAVKIYLPLYGETAAEVQGSDQLQYLPAAAVTGSILIVDDEDMIRTIAAQILTTAGYRVQTCADGQEAVDLYVKDHRNIDLVIMDMVMPRLDGREAFEQMRKINRKVKVLLSSGFSEDGDAQAILKAGASGFIQKPYRSAELLARVQQALQVTPNQSLRGNPPA